MCHSVHGLPLVIFQLYQIYAKRSAEEVHDIMVKYNVSYMILEDSICRAPSRDGCRLPDLMDRDNGMVSR